MENNETASVIAELQTTLPRQTIAIIGGGLTGLITAHLLEQRFAELNKPVAITIFEKSAGVGRLATRYKQPSSSSASLDSLKNNGVKSQNKTLNQTVNDTQRVWQFDFGAQFFTAKSKAFAEYIQQWQQNGVVERWQAQTAKINNLSDRSDRSDSSGSILDSDAIHNAQLEITCAEKWDNPQQPRYISSPKMTSWGREIAKVLKHTNIRFKTRVAPLSKAKHQVDHSCQTSLVDEHGSQLGSFDWVICTAPQAQAIELFAATTFKPFDSLSEPKMLACYTLMLGWASEERLPTQLRHAYWDVLNVDSQEASYLNALDRVFIEHKKPSRSAILPSVTIHSGNEWAQAHVDDELADIKAILLNQAQRVLGFDEHTYPDHIDCHRWRYAATQTNETAAKPVVFIDEAKQWLVTGDWCHEGRIESCYMAASNVVNVII